MKKWTRFERLTAALRSAQNRGADVRWNDSINGWQVDVSVRTVREGATYLEIIECKDHGRRVTQEQIAAFITKVQETGADAGSSVSATGFQKGARALARKRGVIPYTLKEVFAVWPSPVQAVEVPFVEWGEAAVLLEGGWRPLTVREVAEARFTWTPTSLTVDFAEVIERPILQRWDELQTDSILKVGLQPGWVLRLSKDAPDLVPLGVGVRARRVLQKQEVSSRFPEEVRPTEYAVTEELTGSADTGKVSDLPFGFDSVLKEGMKCTGFIGERLV